MSKNKKRKLTPWEALSRVTVAPKTEVAQTPSVNRWSTSGLQAFRHRYEQSDEAEQLALEGWSAQAEQVEAKGEPLRKAKSELSANIQRLMEQDSSTLYSAESEYLKAFAPNIGTGEQFIGIAPESIKATIRKAFSTFEDQIASEGTLTASGKTKLQNLMRANLNADSTQSETWYAAFLLLRTVGELLDQGDSESPDFVVTEIQDEPAQPRTLDDVLATNDSFSREGRKAIATAAWQDMEGEVRTWFQAFSDSLRSNFQHVLTAAETKAVCDQMYSRNRSWTSAKNWDLSRCECVANGTLPSTLLYPDERLAALIADDSTDTRSYEGRRKVRQQERQILGR